MSEFSSGDSDPAGKPWLSDDEVLMHIPCMPGQEEAVIGFMRALPVEHYVDAQAFFSHPERSLTEIIVAAYEEVSGEAYVEDTSFFSAGGIGEERSARPAHTTIEESLTFIEYLQSLEEAPSREQFDGLCEDHGSFWTMVEGPKTDPADSKILGFVAHTLKAYSEYAAGKRRLIMLPESVFAAVNRIAEANSPEAIQAKREELKQAVQSILDFLGPVPESLLRQLERAESLE